MLICVLAEIRDGFEWIRQKQRILELAEEYHHRIRDELLDPPRDEVERPRTPAVTSGGVHPPRIRDEWIHEQQRILELGIPRAVTAADVHPRIRDELLDPPRVEEAVNELPELELERRWVVATELTRVDTAVTAPYGTSANVDCKGQLGYASITLRNATSNFPWCTKTLRNEPYKPTLPLSIQFIYTAFLQNDARLLQKMWSRRMNDLDAHMVQRPIGMNTLEFRTAAVYEKYWEHLYDCDELEIRGIFKSQFDAELFKWLADVKNDKSGLTAAEYHVDVLVLRCPLDFRKTPFVTAVKEIPKSLLDAYHYEARQIFDANFTQWFW
jgi:hypothetical protein